MEIVGTRVLWGNLSKELPDVEKDDDECTDMNGYEWLHKTYFSVSIIMVCLSVLALVLFRTWRNSESMTLICLVVLKWLWYTAIWGCIVWQPRWFMCNMLAMTDVTGYIDVYLWGIINLVVFLQWAQVYRVLTSPRDARETLAHNWAVKMQCGFVTYFTTLIIVSCYFGMWQHLDNDV